MYLKIKRKNLLALCACATLVVAVPFMQRPTAQLITEKQPDRVIQTDIFVYGTTLGGASAAITAAERGSEVVLASPSERIGGQAVEAGMSAFDENGRLWEESGLYADLKEFIREKYNQDADERYVGLGRSVVGTLATLPEDVEEFFIDRIRQNSNKSKLQLFMGYELVELRGQNGHYSSALLQQREHPQESLLIEFTFLLDGTQTGDVFAEIGRDTYNVGFDTQEETNEPSAFTREQRQALVAGYEDGFDLVAGLGNRTQSVGAAVATVDRGYYGSIVTPDLTGSSCWQVSDGEGYILHNTVYEASRRDCAVQIELEPDFADIYDVYLITHGAEKLDAEILLPESAEPIRLQQAINPNETFTKIGSFALGPNTTTTVTLFSEQKNALMEGVLLQKKNLHAEMRTLTDSFAIEHPITAPDGRTLEADVYLRTDDVDAQRIGFMLGAQRVTARRIGKDTYRAVDVQLTSTPQSLAFLDRTTAVQTQEMHIIPTHQFTPLAFTHQPSTAIREIDADGGQLLQWEMRALTDGLHALSVQDWPRFTWGELSIESKDTRNTLSTFRFNAPLTTREFGRPIGLIEMKAEETYRIRLQTDASVTDGFTVQVQPLAKSGILHGKGLYPELTPLGVDALYDVWVRPHRPTEVTVFTDHTRTTLPVQQNDALTFLGRTFVHRYDTIQTVSDHEIDILAIPVSHVPLYRAPVSLDTETRSMTIDTLPAGQYEMHLLQPGDQLLKSVELTNADSLYNRTYLSLEKTQSTEKGTEILKHSGTSIVASFPEAGDVVAGELIFYDAFPTNVVRTFQTGFPLLKTTRTEDVRDDQTFFAYRNLVAPSMLHVHSFLQPALQHLGRNTNGVSLTLTPFNDYAPVRSRDIGTQELTDAARSFSYDYVYWLRFDVPQTLDVLGCASTNLSCDTRRITLAPELLGRSDSFAEELYIREARRVRTVESIREQDLALSTNDATPVLSTDALAAVHYPFDVHTYLSQEELADGKQSAFLEHIDRTDESTILSLQTYSKPGQITLRSLVPESVKNVLPASTNIGLTQITASAWRTHPIEMAIGSAAGHVASFSHAQNLLPIDLINDPTKIRTLQKNLNAQGVVLYPIDDIPQDDKLLYEAAQHLILAGKLTPRMTVEAEHHAFYRIDPTLPANEDDNWMMHDLFGKRHSGATYRDLFSLFAEQTDPLPNVQLRALGKSVGLIDPALKSLKTDTLLRRKVTRGALMKAWYRKHVRKEKSKSIDPSNIAPI